MEECYKTLIVQRILPPYRLAFFQKLATSPRVCLELAYGQTSLGSALESLENPSELIVRKLYNVDVLKRNVKFVFQRGSLALIDPKKVRVIITEFNPRVISNIIMCIVARRRGIRFIWWGHGLRPFTGKLESALYVHLAKKAHALVFYNQEGADKFVELGIHKSKVFVAWNSIDTEHIGQLVEQRAFSERNRVLYIGRLIAAKKVDLLMRAFAQSVQHLPALTKLTLVGDGPERKKLEELAQELGIEGQVEFVGSLFHEDQLAPFFNSSWVSVSAGYIGLSAIHSFAYGVPMLVADKEPHSPEIAAIERGVNAEFFTADDAADLSKKLCHFVQFPTRLEEMGAAAQQTIREKFSVDAMVNVFENAIEYACSHS